MSRSTIRLSGFLMGAIAAASMYVAYSLVRPEPVAAAACCTQCENNEAAGYLACEQQSHGSCNGLQDCYNMVESSMEFCWAHCTYSCSGGCSYNYTCTTWDWPDGSHGQDCGYTC
jgi:hypothetical protein